MPTPDSDLHMAVTELFDGGIVNNEKIAAEIARLVLESATEANNDKAHVPGSTVEVSIAENDDAWLATVCSTPQQDVAAARPLRIEIRKRDARVRILAGPQLRYLLASHVAAENFAAVLVTNAAGEEELQRQMPLIVNDNGDTWLVNGRGNVTHAKEGPGPFRLEVEKTDGRVLDMWFEWVIEMPPSVQALLSRNVRSNS